MDPKEISDLMDAETWMQSDVALASKFVDEIVPNKAAAAMGPQMVAGFDLSMFRNVPTWAKKESSSNSHKPPEIHWRKNHAQRRLDQMGRISVGSMSNN